MLMCPLKGTCVMKNLKCVVATHKLRCQLNPPNKHSNYLYASLTQLVENLYTTQRVVDRTSVSPLSLTTLHSQCKVSIIVVTIRMFVLVFWLVVDTRSKVLVM